MKVFKPDNLALQVNPCRIDGSIYLSVGVLACFSLDAEATASILPESVLWKTAAAYLDRNTSFDMGYPKRQGEFLVHGTAWNKKPTAAQEVSVTAGAVTKTLQVTGERHWQTGGIPSPPEPFLSIPVNFTTAFGGPGYPFNPIGKGFAAGADGIRMLPNVQYPAKTMTSPQEKPLPASFAPYPETWTQRQSLLGRFDDSWLTEKWPFFPVGASPDYFSTAPEDQRLPGFFQGNEALVIINMHPERARIESCFPGLRARIFKVINGGKREDFSEIKNRCETLWLYPQELQGIVLYRGLTPVNDEELDDVQYLFADWEFLAEAAQPEERYFERFQEALNPVSLPLPEMPQAATAPAPAVAYPAVAEGSAGTDELTSMSADLEAKTEAQLRELGMTREELMEKHGFGAEPESPVSMDTLEKDIADLEGEAEKRLKELGLKREELLARYVTPAADDNPAGPSELIDQTRNLLEEVRGQMAAARLEEETIKDYLPEGMAADFPKVGEIEQSLALLGGAAATAPPAAPGLSLSAGEILERFSRGESLRGVDAAGADFTGCKLPGADFAEAMLAGACFSGADLRGANFRRAIIRGADFRGADMTGACMAEATGPDAVFNSARMEKTDMKDGDWTGADLGGALLGMADLSRALLRKAILKGCSARECRAVGTDFGGSDLSGTDFSNGDLTGADCTGALLDKGIFTGVRASNLHIFAVRGAGTDFRNAILAGIRGGAEAILKEVCLKGADLTGASLGGTVFIDADLEEASLDYGDFNRVAFTNCRMLNATARETSFMKAVFIKSDLRGLNLFRGSLRKARLEEVDLRDANLYGVDFFEAKLKETLLHRSNMQRTLLALKGGFH